MNLLNIPEQGIMYALYVDRVVYQKYSRDKLLQNKNLQNKLLELHLFDETRVYRYIKARNGEIETVISDDTVEHQDQYTERIFTLADKKENPDENSGRIEVINYITYDEDDLMRIQNYRLKEVR